MGSLSGMVVPFAKIAEILSRSTGDSFLELLLGCKFSLTFISAVELATKTSDTFLFFH